MSVSIGIVTVTGFEASTADPMILLRNADAAMYRAKRGGKARWALFDESLVSAATHRRELEPELRRALEADEFVLHYQPIYDLNDDTIVGVEALVRWNHPTRGLLAPDAFLGLAEETGLIVGIGVWVLEESCNQMRQWACELRWPGWMSVNFSARQVAEPGLASAVSDILIASGLRAELLRLELTETALLRVSHSAAAELDAVRSLGVHIGMDDFGTGYASLTNLQQLPIDFLKIDRSFVTTLERDGNGRDHGNAIVAAIAQIGQTLDLETIAEGIETEEQAELLRAYGCPYGQGYQFARPAAADRSPSYSTTTTHTPCPTAGHEFLPVVWWTRSECKSRRTHRHGARRDHPERRVGLLLRVSGMPDDPRLRARGVRRLLPRLSSTQLTTSTRSYAHTHALETDGTFGISCRLLAKDGHYVWLESRGCAARKDTDGRVTAIEAIWRDVSKSMSASQERTRTTSLLEAANARLAETLEREHDVVEELRKLDLAKTDFVSTVSHELRTPLTSIIGYMEILNDEGGRGLDPEQMLAFQIIERNSRRLRSVIENLLTISSVETGALSLSPAPTHFGPIIESAVSTVMPAAEEQGIELTTRVPADLPAVWADPSHADRIVLNLLSNAIKFLTPTGGHVEISAAPVAGNGTVTVRDDGMGIPDDEQTPVRAVLAGRRPPSERSRGAGSDCSS